MSTRKLPASVTREEHQLVQDFLVIPVMLDYIDEDISVIEKCGLKTDLLLINALRKVREDIFAEQFDLRSKMKRSGIKVIENKSTELGVNAAYLCRGYRHNMSLFWSLIRAEILSKASQYTGIQLTTG
jgi:hypothetical protein